MSLFCGMSQKKWSVKLDLNVMYILSAYFVTLEVEVREEKFFDKAQGRTFDLEFVFIFMCWVLADLFLCFSQ